MSDTSNSSRPVHPAAKMYAKEYLAGEMNRREFFARATALGVTAAGAYALIGLDPAEAGGHRATPPTGGTLRIQSEVRAGKDPRTYDTNEHGNNTRGIVEYLIELNADGTFTGILLESWEASEDASQYTLRVRPGITFNNGDAFTAEHVAANFIGWADTSVEGNSMATRMVALVDEATGQAAEGSVVVVDDMTVQLNLVTPSILIVPAMAEYPGAIQHKDYIGQDPLVHGVGTGAYRLVSHEVGISSVLERNPDHTYWGEAYLDGLEFVDYGTDPAAWFAGADAGEFDMTFETQGEFIDIFDAIGWTNYEVATANTIVIRCNQLAAPYDDARVRMAINMAVDLNELLELGLDGRGITAENHHVSEIHPEYATIDPIPVDKDGALALLTEAGFADHVFEVISLDGGFERETTAAYVAQLRDAGFNAEHVVLPASTFWNDWTGYPISSTAWNGRVLGVEIYNLAYRTGVPWNEAAYANPEFDSLLDQANGIQDAEERRAIMAQLQTIMRDDAVVCQPYWRSVYRHAAPNVVNAEMHPKFEINPHYLGLA